MAGARGVVAAGHPVTAEAGAWVLREGGNAIDAAVAAVLASCVAESPLTGVGAGGYMLVHDRGESEVIDFFVEAPGRGGLPRRAELEPVPVHFSETTTQIFNVGAASCGVPGTLAGLDEALRRHGSVDAGDLAAPAVAAARNGVRITTQQAYVMQLLEPILTRERPGRRDYAPHGRILREGELLKLPELAETLEHYGSEGAEPFYRGDPAERIAEAVQSGGGTIATADLAAYRPIVRRPVEARFRGTRVVTNPPPSSGGILIAYALELLERLRSVDIADVVSVMDAAQASRDRAFHSGLGDEDFADRFLDPRTLDIAAERLERRIDTGPQAGDALGSTTHITAVDGEGRCASVTCSNGTGSGVFPPGTGIHLNNMLGEQDLNPSGFHRHRPGTRMPSMMAPTVVLSEGGLVAALGSAGSNRIRSAILQTIIRLVADRLDAQAAVEAPRVHFEDAVVQVEPGVDELELAAVERRGYRVNHWDEINLFFGGVQCVARDPRTGLFAGGGDPRRGGSVSYA